MHKCSGPQRSRPSTVQRIAFRCQPHDGVDFNRQHKPWAFYFLVPGRPFGTIDITGMSLLGNSPEVPLGDFSTVYEIQVQLSRTIGRHTLKFGVQFRRVQSDGSLDFVVNGLYTFQDLSPFGIPAFSNNPALEFFLQAMPLSYVGVDPSMSDSHRSYRENFVAGFAQDSVRVTRRLTVNVGLRYEFYSNPTEEYGRLSSIFDPATDSGPTVGKVFARTPADLLSPQAGFAWDIFGDGKTVVRSGAGIFRDQLPVSVFGVDRFLPPFFGLESFVFPSFLNPRNAVLAQSIDILSTTYRPKFPYAIQYNLNVQREIAPGTVVSAGYFGARGNHLTREAEQNPFEPDLGHRYNPNLPSPLLAMLTDGQSFYNSFQLSASKKVFHNLSWQAFYTLAHSKNLLYCYGCGRGGDVIRFAELFYHVRFPQALGLLCQWRGMAPLLDETTRFYSMQLQRHTEAAAYLHQRGIRSPETDRAHADRLRTRRLFARVVDAVGLPTPHLHQTCLVTTAGYDAYKHRIVFPLEGNLYGRSISATAPPHRFLPGSKGGLYSWDHARSADIQK